MTRPRIIFAGTPDFALVQLRALVESGRVPGAVLTQPDRPAGRGKQMAASPVKKYASRQKIPLLQPETLRDDGVKLALEALQPDVMIVAAYGLLLPQSVLDIPRHGCINVHASVLPRWRGAAPVQAAILGDDRCTGVSLMRMTTGLDCGPVYCASSVTIGAGETAGDLHDRLAALGGELLAEKLDDILAGRIEAASQDAESATYARKIRTRDARLDWSLSAEELLLRVRAYNPVPGAYFFAGDSRVKCWHARLDEHAPGASGTVVESGADGVVVACGDEHEACGLRMESLQISGKRRVTAQEFAAQTELLGCSLR